MKNTKTGNTVKDDLINIVSYLVLPNDIALKPGVSDVGAVPLAA